MKRLAIEHNYHTDTYSVETLINTPDDENSTASALKQFLDIFPNHFGINLCSVKSVSVTFRDDEQIQTIQWNLSPTDNKQELKDMAQELKDSGEPVPSGLEKFAE